VKSIKDNHGFDEVQLRVIFDEYMSKALARQKDEKRREDKKLKKKMDAFKVLLRRADPPIQLSTSYEEVRLT
jgi:pre-mRNA-processing factor 40